MTKRIFASPIGRRNVLGGAAAAGMALAAPNLARAQGPVEIEYWQYTFDVRVRAIEIAPWPKNYVQFADVVSFVGRRLAGFDFAVASSGTYAPASTVVRWVHDLGVDRRLVGMRPD